VKLVEYSAAYRTQEFRKREGSKKEKFR